MSDNDLRIVRDMRQSIGFMMFHANRLGGRAGSSCPVGTYTPLMYRRGNLLRSSSDQGTWVAEKGAWGPQTPQKSFIYIKLLGDVEYWSLSAAFTQAVGAPLAWLPDYSLLGQARKPRPHLAACWPQDGFQAICKPGRRKVDCEAKPLLVGHLVVFSTRF